MKTKAGDVLELDEHAASCRIYLSDASSGSELRVEMSYPNGVIGEPPFIFDHPLSEYSTLSAGQKTLISQALGAISSETLAIEGFS